jgi:glycosyltransferase involved in cell wall biosynthesis
LTPERDIEILTIQTEIVSIIVPAFNGEQTILKCISSIIKQKYKPIEIIIINDGSKDSTASLVKDYFDKIKFDGLYSVVNHEKNLGLSRTLNDGIDRTKGNYVLILHQDCELVAETYISKAMTLMEDNQVAIVTGYYGISDSADDTFVKRAFGVLRKQFHTRPTESCEEATFSEGKCDLFRKEYLLKAGGFPKSYRIAGEDLIVSYSLRRMGYKILKCYDLAVIQRFTGAAESFGGNLGKEFLFGKVMGGVFSKFKLFLFKGAKNSNYSGSRSLHRASQPLFTLAFLLTLLGTIVSFWFIFAFLGLFLLRGGYYFFKVFKELKIYRHQSKYFALESVAVPLIGILTDFAYSFGFGYGTVRHGLRKDL